MNKKIITGAALAVLMTAAVAFAQTYTSPTSGASTGAGTTPAATGATTSSTPGTPNTGVGGDVAQNILILGVSAAAGITSALYLRRKETR